MYRPCIPFSPFFLQATVTNVNPNMPGPTVVVVGGNRGLGLELVKGFIAKGAETYVTIRGHGTDKNLEGLGLTGVIGGE